MYAAECIHGCKSAFSSVCLRCPCCVGGKKALVSAYLVTCAHKVAQVNISIKKLFLCVCTRRVCVCVCCVCVPCVCACVCLCPYV